ncbi:MAG: hypothetical protein HY928_16210 [Elusimicrobia bacterium]|nr:hypothetical protein [Elusimicrobiota bacterium]
MNRLADESENAQLRLLNGRSVGHIDGETARLRVKRGRHFFWKKRGYSVDDHVLRTMQRAGIKEIVFDDSQLGREFRIPLDRFLDVAETFDCGFGQKWCAHECHYDAAELPDRPDDQLDLFSGAPLSA